MQGRALRHLLTALLLLLPAVISAQEPTAVARYAFRIVDKVAQPRSNFVQGLQIHDAMLYVSTGLYGSSRLLTYAFPSMELQKEVALPDSLFAEGVTRFRDRLYQLTWRAGELRLAASLTYERSVAIATEGWGITHDGAELIYSDGTPILRYLDPESLTVVREVPVTILGQPLPRLNELEYIDGEIWANVWQANQLVRINPASGVVTGIVDLRGLLNPADRDATTDVLNGIAWDAKTDALWVTGKRWPWIFRIKVIPHGGGS